MARANSITKAPKVVGLLNKDSRPINVKIKTTAVSESRPIVMVNIHTTLKISSLGITYSEIPQVQDSRFVQKPNVTKVSMPAKNCTGDAIEITGQTTVCAALNSCLLGVFK